MRRLFLLLLILAGGGYGATAQNDDTVVDDSTAEFVAYIPYYEWSIGLEHSYVPGIFTQSAYAPDNLELSFRIHNRLYFEGGIFSGSADTVPGVTFFSEGFAVYGGVALKLFLFRNAWFTPSLHLFFDRYRDNLEEVSFSLGPTASFEYFIGKRISLRADVFNVNIGIGAPYGLGDFPILTLHRILGLGVRYNFDVKRS